MPAFVCVPSAPLEEDYFREVDPEYFDEFPTEESSFARDSVSTGLEAEALIKKYGGDLFTPVELAPMAATQPASFFRESLPTSSGIELPPDFSRVPVLHLPWIMVVRFRPSNPFPLLLYRRIILVRKIRSILMNFPPRKFRSRVTL